MGRVHITLSEQQFEKLCTILTSSNLDFCPSELNIGTKYCDKDGACSKCWAEALKQTDEIKLLIARYEKRIEEDRKQMMVASFEEANMLGTEMSTLKDVVKDLKL